MLDYFDLNPDINDPSQLVLDIRNDLEELIMFFENLPNTVGEENTFNSYQDYQRYCYSKYIKQIDPDILKQSRAFMVSDSITIKDIPPKFKEEKYGICFNGYLALTGRMCFPVMDYEGVAMGFVCHDKFVKPKYLDIKVFGYIPKTFTFLGMEKMKDYYNTYEPVFITEGLGCMLYLRSRGFKALSALGSHFSPYCLEILSRLHNPVVVPDSDSAGFKMRQQAYKAGFKTFTVPPQLGKDLDDARAIDEVTILKMLNDSFYHFMQ